MRKLLLIVSVFLAHDGVAQTENSMFKSVVDQFERYYNNESYDSIFCNFSSSMQQHMPLGETREFFGGLYSEAGKIVSRKVVQAQASQSSYNTFFERGTFTFDLSLDQEGKISRLVLKPYLVGNFPELIRNKSKLILPFKGAWTVIWGGDTPEQNYHVENQAQKNGFDFLMVGGDGKSYRSDGEANEDYFAFGQEIIAPCDGEVVLVVDGIKDNNPGNMNPMYIPGNTIIIKSPNQEYLLFAHLMLHSINVKPGDIVEQGQVLGLCGNSGNSTEPHLHFHIQNVEDINRATGAKTYFEKILVNGDIKTDHSPVKGEVVQPEK